MYNKAQKKQRNKGVHVTSSQADGTQLECHEDAQEPVGNRNALPCDWLRRPFYRLTKVKEKEHRMEVVKSVYVLCVAFTAFRTIP